MKKMKTNNGRKGGWLVGKRHYDKDGNPLGGIKAVVTDAGGKPVELEGGEVIINREASKKHWKELSKINQSAGNGVAIGPPAGADEDPEEYKDGGRVIDFNPNHIPNKWILSYAEKIKKNHPEIWKLGGNIFGNEAFENLKRVANRGHWLDSEEWMYIKWRSYVARHIHDFRIEGVVAMLKWVDKVEKGWPYMKQLIEEKIAKKSKKGWKHKTTKMKQGGDVNIPLNKLKALPKGSIFEDAKKIDGIFKKSKHSWSEVIEIFEDNKEKAKNKIIDLKEINITQSNIQSHKIESMLQNFDELPIINVVEFNDGLVIYDGHHRLTTAWLLGKNKIKVNIVKAQLNNKMKDGGNLIKRADGTYSERGLWDNIRDNIGSGKKPTKEMLEQEAEIKSKMKDGGDISNRSSNCNDFIKNTRSILSNGYYHYFENLSIYAESGQRIPSIKSFYLITYNSGGQKDLKVTDTINSTLAVDVIAKHIGSTEYVSRIIISDFIKESRRFDTLDILPELEGQNVIIIDRDHIACSNRNDKPKMKDSGLIAPNGKTSNLTPDQYKLVRTPAFKAWFGDWENDPENSSKVVDENGEPLVVWHGSDKDYNIFDKDKTYNSRGYLKITGFYFTTNKKEAKEYGKPKSYFLNLKIISSTNNGTESDYTLNKTKIKKILKNHILKETSRGETYYQFVDKTLEEKIDIISKKKDISNQLYDIWHEFFNYLDEWDDESKKWKKSNKLSLFYEALTNSKVLDGVRLYFDKRSPYLVYYIAFHPNQIKLADGTNTTFDGSNPDIRFKDGGELAMGIKAEHEHSKTISKFKKPGISDLDVETAIATDHLKEDPHYYSKLSKMESKKYATGGLIISGVEVNIGDTVKIKAKGVPSGRRIKITNITDKWVIFTDLADGKRKDNAKDAFLKNFIEKEGSVSTPQSVNIDQRIKNAQNDFQKSERNVTDLPKGLVLRVWANQKAQGNTPTSEIRLDADTFDGNFYWSESIEGEEFWNQIYDGEWLSDDVLKVMGSKEAFFETSSKSSDLEPLSEASEISVQQKEIQTHKYEDETEIRSERDLLIDEYNDITFLISITPSTDVDNMLALKQQSKELKDKLDALDLELKKKIDGEINLLENLFKASTVKPQERYQFKPYNDGFAPNGQPTELPKHIYDWTMTQEFINWFGNFTTAYNYKNSGYLNTPCSVVVNKNYEPLIVYHGTGSEFSFFKFDKFPAMYFAENVDYANWFAEIKGRETGSNGYIYPFLLNIRTPLDLTYFKIDDVSPQDFIDWMFLQTGLDEDELKINKALLNPNGKHKVWMYMRNSPEMLQVLREKNVCDGIIYYEDNPSVDKTSSAYQTKAYIVFNSNSAKIADPSRDKLTISAMRSFYLKKGGKI